MKIIRNFSWFFEIPIDREVSEKRRAYIFQVRFSGKSRTKKKFIVFELAKMMLQLCQIACSRHGCISFSPRSIDLSLDGIGALERNQINSHPGHSFEFKNLKIY